MGGGVCIDVMSGMERQEVGGGGFYRGYQLDGEATGGGEYV